MGTAVISGLFAVALACLAWILKNGSRRARLLSRIERYTLVLKDLPEGHPARVHLDAALAADTEQLLALTSRKARGVPQDPWPPPPAVEPGPAYAGGDPTSAYGPSGSDHEDRDGIDWMDGDQERRGPSSPPVSPAQPPFPTPAQPPLPAPAPVPAKAKASAPPRGPLLSGHGSTVLWVLACLSAVVTVGLVMNDLWF